MFNTTELDLNRLIIAFRQGANRVITMKNELNEINVFPVADGDTGSNLASLMSAIHETTYQKNETVTNFFDKIAEAAFQGARGNSGIILSQYFSGLAHFLQGNQFQDFTQTAVASVDYAYEAIDNPIEGTMLTVIKVWADELAKVYAETGQVKHSLAFAFTQAEMALKNTPNQLAILKKQKVVDSGAKGFVYFLEGFTETFLAEKLDTQALVSAPAVVLESSILGHPATTEEPSFRYCTEVLLTDTDESMAEIKEGLRAFGDSLVVAKNKKIIRIHLHTNQPTEVIAYLNKLGKITQQKADDMLLQYRINKAPNAKIALITDSVADIPADILLAEQIHVLPMSLLVDDVTYIDKVTLDSSRLFSLKNNSSSRPTTSLPSPMAIQNLFSFIDSHYEKAIVVTIAKELSGTFNAIQHIVEKNKTNQLEVAIIDSKQNSAAQGLVVLEAAKLIREGQSFDAIVAATTDIVKRTKIYVSLDSIDAMIESGRVSSTIGKLLKKVKLNPIVSLDEKGDGAIAGMAFSRKKNEQKIQRKVKQFQTTSNILSYSIVHADNPHKAQEWAAAFTAILGIAPTFVMPISTVVALGAGEGSVAIAFTYQEGGN